jgi:hypothetical protein
MKKTEDYEGFFMENPQCLKLIALYYLHSIPAQHLAALAACSFAQQACP